MEINPISDREILLQLNSDIKQMKGSFAEAIDRLSETIERFGENMKTMEEEKIFVMRKEIDELKEWRQELKGGYKLVMIFWALITAGIIALSKFIFK